MVIQVSRVNQRELCFLKYQCCIMITYIQQHIRTSLFFYYDRRFTHDASSKNQDFQHVFGSPNLKTTSQSR